MNLIIDVGNSFVKLAIFSGDDIVYKVRFEISDFEGQYKTICKKFPELKKAIISSVGYLESNHVKIVKANLNPLVLNSETKLAFENSYETTKTLGVDRIALVSASVKHFPNKNVLIIDAGTCITYDFITNENNYLGGAISPGIRLRYKSLNNLTAKLPLLDTEAPNGIIGKTTEMSIHSGVVNGIVYEIDGVIYAYKKKYQDLTVILTGGDAKFLSNQLKNSIFANSDFLLEGLNYILEFNSK